MTKGELFEKAWRLGFEGDFHLVDEIYHPDYKAIDHWFGIETNIDSDKAIINVVTYRDSKIITQESVVNIWTTIHLKIRTGTGKITSD